ncbi:hypothetical protein ACTSEZ_07540 [Metabacillus sp. JX24]|uniref:hypothetical protein n=1 Tax=Metabacillus sp. JX24 TaxID=3240759 RepID=UPI003510AF77
MEQIKVGSWLIEIDLIKTKEFYQKFHLITEDCGCDYCSNYVLACDSFPKNIKNTFNLLGIDPRKEGEVYELIDNEDGTHLYGGFYHIVGKIIDGPDIWKPSEETVDFPTLGRNDMEIGFNKDLALVPSSFPRPVIQFQFEMNVPWLLS